MQALEKIVINSDWITILLVLLFVCIFFLKGMDAKKPKGYALVFFNKNFIEDESEENISFFNLFQVVIFIFSIIVLSLLTYFILSSYAVIEEQVFYSFWKIFLSLFSYFLLKRVIEYLLSAVFLIKKEVHFFLVSKFIYLCTISFYIFVCLILVKYTELNVTFLIYISILLFLMRFSFHVINNKNLIFNKLFYFILYFCALEIAPLFILFKLMF